MEIRVAGKYRVAKFLGRGAFGRLYQGISMKTGEDVAIKMERLDCESPMLSYESKLLEKFQGNTGFSQMHWHGVEGDYTVLVMDILGPSLEDLFQFCNRKFSLKTVLWIASELIQRLETMHNLEFLHRDIKPENFCLGTGKKAGCIYIIDFGLAKRYRCPKTDQHIAKK